MHAHERAVDHLDLAVVRLDDGVHQAIPDARLAPAIEAVVGRRVRPVTLGQIAPRRAGAQHPENAVQNSAIVARFGPSSVHRQKRLDHAPLEVGEIVAHDPSSYGCQLESLFAPIR